MHPICTLRRSGTQTDVEEQEQTMSQALISAGVRTSGGEGGIRTLGTGVSPYNGLANRRIRPLCHLSDFVYNKLPRLSIPWHPMFGKLRLSSKGATEWDALKKGTCGKDLVLGISRTILPHLTASAS